MAASWSLWAKVSPFFPKLLSARVFHHGNRSETRGNRLLGVCLRSLYLYCKLFAHWVIVPPYSFSTVQISMSVMPCALPTHHVLTLLGATSALAILALHRAMGKWISQTQKWHVKVSRGFPRRPGIYTAPCFSKFLYIIWILLQILMNASKIHHHVDEILSAQMFQAPTSALAFPAFDRIQKDPRHMATLAAKVMFCCIGKGSCVLALLVKPFFSSNNWVFCLLSFHPCSIFLPIHSSKDSLVHSITSYWVEFVSTIFFETEPPVVQVSFKLIAGLEPHFSSLHLPTAWTIGVGDHMQFEI